MLASVCWYRIAVTASFETDTNKATNKLTGYQHPAPDDAGLTIQRFRGFWLLFGPLRIVSNREMVPRRGLEPPRLAAHGPEPCASTNSATWARRGALEGGRVAVNAVLRRLAPAHEFSVAVQRTGVDSAVFAGDGAPFRQVLRDRDAHAGRARRLSRGKPGRAAGAGQWRRAAGVPVAAAGPCDGLCRGLADRGRCAICAIVRDRRPRSGGRCVKQPARGAAPPSPDAADGL